MTVIKQIIRLIKMMRRTGGVRSTVNLVRQGPQYVQLYRRLLMDPAVPVLAKVVLVGGIIFAFSPLNLPQYIPVVGALDDIGIILFAGNFFLRQVPRETLRAHRRAVGLDPVLDPR